MSKKFKHYLNTSTSTLSHILYSSARFVIPYKFKKTGSLNIPEKGNIQESYPMVSSRFKPRVFLMQAKRVTAISVPSIRNMKGYWQKVIRNINFKHCMTSTDGSLPD